MSVLESKRKQTPFEVRDNMLNVWMHITELSMRGFGIKPRKMPKTPKNFDQWSDDSKEKWQIREQENLRRKETWDTIFVRNETRVVDDFCRRIVDLIDQANTIFPQYICECDQQRLMQDEVIGLCNNLIRELNHIADTIPCNKNFLALQTEDIEKEINLVKGWRKSCNQVRDKVLIKEIQRRKTAAEKIGFIIAQEDIDKAINEIE